MLKTDDILSIYYTGQLGLFRMFSVLENVSQTAAFHSFSPQL